MTQPVLSQDGIKLEDLYFCADCTYLSEVNMDESTVRKQTEFAKCTHPKIEKVQFDLVSGALTSTFPYAELERLNGHECGPDGVLFKKATHPHAEYNRVQHQQELLRSISSKIKAA